MEEALMDIHGNSDQHLACLIYMVEQFLNKQKGCSSYYRLINESRTKTDCWLNPRLTLEKELLDVDQNYLYDNKQYDIAISKISGRKDYNF